MRNVIALVIALSACATYDPDLLKVPDPCGEPPRCCSDAFDAGVPAELPRECWKDRVLE